MSSRLPRRGFAALLAAAALPMAGDARLADDSAGTASDEAEWEAFCARFLKPDGRIVDTGNDGVSHSEGQGWGLLCAVRFGDRARFEQMLGWTRRTLARPSDALHAWRFRPGAAESVDDPNNATDGDLMIGWALLLAAERWGDADHAALGRAIARDTLRLLVRRVGARYVLLPGVRGFEHPDHVVVNPSYYAFPALRALAQAVPDPLWLRVVADGLELLRAGRFGRWGLSPDWLAVRRQGDELGLPNGWPPRFGYDAIRVPLYLCWAGLSDEPAVSAAVRFWATADDQRVPAWADLATDALAPYAASPAVLAIYRLASAARRPRTAEAGLSSTQRIIPPETDYYSAILLLLVRLAWRDTVADTI